MLRRFSYEQIFCKNCRFGRHCRPHSDRGGGLKPVHADWVLVSSTDAIINPGSVSASIPGAVYVAPATANSTASVVYRWRPVNGEFPADHAYINHTLQVDGDLTTALSPYQMSGQASASSTINEFTEKDYKVPDWRSPGAAKSFPAILINERTQTVSRYFSTPSEVTQIDATFSASAKNEVSVSAFYDRGTDTYKGSASATASRSAHTSGFSVTE